MPHAVAEGLRHPPVSLKPIEGTSLGGTSLSHLLAEVDVSMEFVSTTVGVRGSSSVQLECLQCSEGSWMLTFDDG